MPNMTESQATLQSVNILLALQRDSTVKNRFATILSELSPETEKAYRKGNVEKFQSLLTSDLQKQDEKSPLLEFSQDVADLNTAIKNISGNHRITEDTKTNISEINAILPQDREKLRNNPSNELSAQIKSNESRYKENTNLIVELKTELQGFEAEQKSSQDKFTNFPRKTVGTKMHNSLNQPLVKMVMDKMIGQSLTRQDNLADDIYYASEQGTNVDQLAESLGSESQISDLCGAIHHDVPNTLLNRVRTTIQNLSTSNKVSPAPIPGEVQSPPPSTWEKIKQTATQMFEKITGTSFEKTSPEPEQNPQDINHSVTDQAAPEPEKKTNVDLIKLEKASDMSTDLTSRDSEDSLTYYDASDEDPSLEYHDANMDIPNVSTPTSPEIDAQANLDRALKQVNQEVKDNPIPSSVTASHVKGTDPITTNSPTAEGHSQGSNAGIA